ncbi:DNA recombination protein RmuC [Altererythrobacter indicus]|uniref:DNA recombination protein RmuC homolog n=1 Tax=Altericroceibacterium indicum TaxID=374177 RepID=A0A845A6R0_9SPHN|nr:DNA recombination protein RmuC [Altericroceibacterium indicum]MXP25900.1 DNA recombination protein RmuC [Altericroceibacterium indicum]
MDPIILIVVLLVGLVIGAAGGWFTGSRPAAEWQARFKARDEEARDLGEKLSRMAPELATMSDRALRADRLAQQLDDAREELTTLKAQAAGFEEQKKLLVEARESMLKEFQNTGSRVLGQAQEDFLKRAAERFGHAEKSSEEKIKALLVPVGEKLRSYEEQVTQLEAKRVDAFGQLAGLIESMRVGQEQVRQEAARLGNSLRNAPKARGRWGEQQLRNVLEQCGLAEHTDFELEQSIETEEGRLRPDAIVNVPGHKKLVIDAKVSLNNYQDAFDADTEELRDIALAAHAKAMRNHVQTLGTKSYQSQFEDAPDYVVMFVPGEHFVAAALEKDPELWDFAFKNRVLLATPTNLVAIARTVAQVWRQVGLAEEAKEIGRLGGELYDRMAKISEDLGKMGTHLGRAVSSYNDFTRSFDTRVLVSARKLREKHVEIGKREISDDIALVEGVPLHASLASPSPDATRPKAEGEQDPE